MIDILKRIAIGIIVGMSIFFLKTEVFAATLTPTTTQYDARYAPINCSSTLGVCQFNEWGTWQGTVNMGTATLNSNNDLGLQQLSLKYYYSSGFVAGNTYNFTFRVNISTANTFEFYKKYFTLIRVRGGDTTSAMNEGTINYSVLVSQYSEDGNNQAWYVTVSATPSVSVKHIWIYYGPPKLNVPFSGFTKSQIANGNVVVRSSNVTYSEGSNSYIQQTTNAVIELITQFTIGNDEIINTDAPPDKTYDNDYSTDDYDTAESNMNQNLDQDVSGFTFNPLSWSHSFSFIWDTVTDFVQINSKVFLMITTFLTFSFVGLVIGRS